MGEEKEEVEIRAFYSVLEVKADASQDDIRVAYKKMALKYHPDRNKAPDAAVKFNQVKKAYEVLKNPDHRSIYDALGEEGLKEAIESQNQSFHPFFGFGGRRRQTGPRKGNAIRLLLRVTLEEIYQGAEKQITFRRRVVNEDGEMTIEEVEKTVHIDKGMKEGHKIKFAEEGDRMPDIVPGDVVVVLQHMKHSFFQRKGPILICAKNLTLREALCGFEFDIKHLDGHIVRIKHSGEVVPPNTLKVVSGEGMPFYRQPFTKGHLVIKFDVIFPPALTPEQTEAVAKALPATKAPEATLDDSEEEEEEFGGAEKEPEKEKEEGKVEKEGEEKKPAEVVESKLSTFDPIEIQKLQQASEAASSAYEEDDHGDGPQVVSCASQ